LFVAGLAARRGGNAGEKFAVGHQFRLGDLDVGTDAQEDGTGNVTMERRALQSRSESVLPFHADWSIVSINRLPTKSPGCKNNPDLFVIK
jgi:hypothetical protein